MKKLFEISNVFNLFVPISPTKVVFANKNKTLCLRQPKELKNIFPKEGLFQGLFLVNNQIWAFEHGQMRTIVFDTKRLESKALTFLAAPMSKIFEEKYVICLLRQNDEMFSGTVDVNTHEIIKQYPSNYGINGIAHVMNQNRFISKTHYQIACHSFADGSEKWKLDYEILCGSKRAEIYGDVFCHNQHVFFIVMASTELFPVCVDLNTGIIIRKLTIAGWPKQVNNKLYLLHANILNVLDMDALSTTAFDFQTIMEAHPGRLSPDKYIVQDNIFYFVIQPTPDGNAAVGAICLETKELLSYEPIPIEKGSYWIIEIRLAYKQLYVLTQGGTLHVFQQPKAKKVAQN